MQDNTKSSTFALRRVMNAGQILMRKVDGRDTLSQPLGPETLDLAA